jgi:hypothetical protein
VGGKLKGMNKQLGTAKRIGGGIFGGRTGRQSNRFGSLRNMISNQVASKLPKPPAAQASANLVQDKRYRDPFAENKNQQLQNQILDQIKPAIPGKPLPGKPLGQAQPLQASQPEQPAQSPSVPFKESIVQQPEPAAPAQPSPAVPPAPAQSASAPQVVSPAAQMQAQKDQMFPPAPAAPAAPATPPPAAPPVAPKPAQVTPPAGVTKSQAEIDEEKKKQMAGMSGMAKTASGSF